MFLEFNNDYLLMTIFESLLLDVQNLEGLEAGNMFINCVKLFVCLFVCLSLFASLYTVTKSGNTVIISRSKIYHHCFLALEWFFFTEETVSDQKHLFL